MLIVLVVLMMLPCYEPRAAAVALQSSALAMPQPRHGRAARAPEGALSGRSPHSSYLWVVLMQFMVNILGIPPVPRLGPDWTKIF